MDETKPSPFKLNRTRIFLLAMGAIVVIIAISMSRGGINAYQALREANTSATQASPEQTAPEAGAEPVSPEIEAP